MIDRRLFLIAAGAAPLARAFPARPLRIVVPFGAGGIADLTARTVGQALGERLGQSVVIENKPGAGGIAAGELVARAQPDGHTLLLMSNGTAVSAGLFSRLPFDPRQDFEPVSLLGLFDLAVIVPEGSRFRTLADLLAAARAQPGKLNLATINVGSTQNLAAELFKGTAGVSLQVVPFNGTPAVVTALRSGEVDAAIEILGPVQPQVAAKALRVLALMNEERPGELPQVRSWNALAAPARTPSDVVRRLGRELQAVLATPAVRQRLAGLHVEARHSSPEELGALLDREIRRWSDVIARAGIPRQ
jgi:tripartite-type tricarboxylate transporter receptor subunit TctC